MERFTLFFWLRFWLKYKMGLVSGVEPKRDSNHFPSVVYIDREGPRRIDYSLRSLGVYRGVAGPPTEVSSIGIPTQGKLISHRWLRDLQGDRKALFQRLEFSERERDEADQQALDTFLDRLEDALSARRDSEKSPTESAPPDLEEITLWKLVTNPSFRERLSEKLREKERKRRIPALRKDLFELDLQLESCRRKVIAACEEAVKAWMLRQVMEFVILRHEVTTDLGEEKISSLKQEIHRLIETELSPRLRENLGRPDDWWHLRRGDQDYFLHPIDKVEMPPTLESLHLGMLEAAELIVVPLRKHGYLSAVDRLSESRATFGFGCQGALTFEWSQGIHDQLLEYEKQMRVGRKLAAELNALEDAPLRETRKIWENA